MDQIITDTPAQCYSTDAIISLLSDHYAQCITINMTVPQQIRYYKETRNVSQANIIGLCSLIQNETWIDVFQENDMKKKWVSFYSIFNFFKFSLDNHQCYYSKNKTKKFIQSLYAK
jgi:hypothetical protein